jgi:hypothetical protein
MSVTLKNQSKCWCDDPECCRVVASDSAGVFRFELVALAALAALYVALLSGGIVEPQELYAAWFMPFLGIAAATIAMSTPAGGGVVFFPTMVLLGIPPFEAVAFSVGAQSVGKWAPRAGPGLPSFWNADQRRSPPSPWPTRTRAPPGR